MARFLLFLLALAAPFAAHAQEAAAARKEMPPLLVEPLSEAWRDKLVPPLLSRLRPLGLYVARETPPAAMPDAMRGAPEALALLRRSSYGAMAQDAGLEAIEIGPAACLLLAVRADQPWAAYADLNYAEGGLRVVTSGPVATGLLGSLTGAMPLKALMAPEERPLRVAFQHLIRGEVDVVAFDAPRRRAAGTPALAAELARERGLRLLVMPASPAASVLSAGAVQLGAGSWLEDAPTHATICDPFLLALRDERADKLLFHLYDGEAAARGKDGGASFTAQIQEAALGLVSLIGFPVRQP